MAKPGIIRKAAGLLSEGIAEANAYEENTPAGREAQFKREREKQRKEEVKKLAGELLKKKPSGPYTLEERNLLVTANSEETGG